MLKTVGFNVFICRILYNIEIFPAPPKGSGVKRKGVQSKTVNDNDKMTMLVEDLSRDGGWDRVSDVIISRVSRALL